MLRILSSPRILTLDNHEARISQGTLIPFSQVSAQGVQTTFQEAKLQLLVQAARDRRRQREHAREDQPRRAGLQPDVRRGDPTILKREAETDLLVMDGHTAVIGGIYTRNTGRNLDQVPFFGDIPLLGLLFQRRRASDTRRRARDLPHAPHREPRRGARPLEPSAPHAPGLRATPLLASRAVRLRCSSRARRSPARALAEKRDRGDRRRAVLHAASPYGEPLIRRRRSTETLLLHVYDLQGEGLRASRASR